MFGINGAEFLIILVIAMVVIGPERLPRYAEQLGRWVRDLRGYADEAKARVSQELAQDGEEVDWRALDPRQYDPRRIVREALLDPGGPPPVTGRVTTTGRAAAGAATAGVPPGGPAPFDDEAT